MKRKYRIIIIALVLLTILITAYIYSVAKDATTLGGATGNIAYNCDIQLIDTKILEKNTLLNIKLSSISGEQIDGQMSNIDGTDIKSFKNNSTGFKSIDSDETTIIKITDEKQNIIKQFELSPKKDLSKWVFLKKGEEYYITISSDKFIGYYYCNSKGYALY